MALQRLDLIRPNLTVDGGGRIVVEPFDVTPGTSNDVWKHKVIRFKNNDGVAKDVIFGKFAVPEQYVDSADLVVIWSSDILVNDIVWDLDYRVVAVGASFDQSGFQASVSVTDTAPGTAWFSQEAIIALTDTDFVKNREVQFQFGRDGIPAAHTFTGNGVLFGLYFRYQDA